MKTARKTQYERPTLKVFGTVRNLTGGSFAAQNDAGMGTGGTNQNSDPRMKENIAQVGSHPAGFNLYLFDYKAEHKERCGADRQFGVMADEVAQVMPEAVSVDEFGYAVVNYGLLGITRH